MATTAVQAGPAVSARDAHPIVDLVSRRVVIGILTLLVVSLVVFLATQVLPGNAAYAVLGRSANPVRLHATERQLHLNRGLGDQYWIWLSGLFTAVAMTLGATDIAGIVVTVVAVLLIALAVNDLWRD